jgi:hypothetical protein
MAKKMTIEDLGAMIERNMASKEDVKVLTEKVQDGFTKVFVEIDGLRDDVKQARGASSIEYAGLREKVEALEEDVRKIKRKVKV